MSALCLALVAGTAIMVPMGQSSVAMALSPRNAPAAPSNLQAHVGTDGRVALSWTDESNNEVGFRIVRERQSGSSWFASGGASVSANITTYSEAPSPATYRYKVRAYNNRGNSSYTDPVVVVVPDPSSPPPPPPPPPPATNPLPPNAPSNVQVADLGGGSIRVSWSDNSSDESSFVVERNPAFANGNVTVGANVTTADDSAGYGTFAYRVTAVNSIGSSAATSWVSITTTSPTNPPPPPPPPTSQFAVIPAGPGFSGATPAMPAVGAVGALGYDAMAIARWDVVPLQTITGDFNIGVVAFHIAGIDRVEFSANGGAWTPVTTMQLNPRTSVWEYTATLRASDFPDGRVEVRARVIPVTGLPRILQGAFDMTRSDLYRGEYSMFLWANSHGSLQAPVAYVSPSGSDTSGNGSQATPYQTIDRALTRITTTNGSADGATIYLMPGTYAAFYGAGYAMPEFTPNRPYVITAAPGHTAAEVTLNAMNRPQNLYTVVRGVTLHPTSDLPSFEGYTDMKRFLWVDQCVFQGCGPTRWSQTTFPAGMKYHFFTTDTLYTNAQEGPRSAAFVRGCECRTMGSDAYSNTQFVVNSSANDLDAGTSGAHPDVMDLDDPTHAAENYIYYGIRALQADSQGFAFENTGTYQDRDIAIVNCLISKSTMDAYQCSFGLPVNHLLVWNCTFPNIQWDWRNDLLHNALFRNVSVKGNVFYAMLVDTARMTPEQLVASAEFSQNHYIQTSANSSSFITPGGYVTTGGALSTLFQDSVLFRPMTTSVIANRLAIPLAPCDMYGQVRTSPSALGAVQP